MGLRTKLTLWSSLVLAATLAAGFVWVHYGLRRVLEARNDAFLERKAAELLAGVTEDLSGSTSDLEAEIGREVLAYEPEGLIVVVRQPGRVFVAPRTAVAQRLADRKVLPGIPRTIELADVGPRYRVRPHAPEAATFLSNWGFPWRRPRRRLPRSTGKSPVAPSSF